MCHIVLYLTNRIRGLDKVTQWLYLKLYEIYTKYTTSMGVVGSMEQSILQGIDANDSQSFKS